MAFCSALTDGGVPIVDGDVCGVAGCAGTGTTAFATSPFITLFDGGWIAVGGAGFGFGSAGVEVAAAGCCLARSRAWLYADAIACCVRAVGAGSTASVRYGRRSVLVTTMVAP